MSRLEEHLKRIDFCLRMADVSITPYELELIVQFYEMAVIKGGELTIDEIVEKDLEIQEKHKPI